MLEEIVSLDQIHFMGFEVRQFPRSRQEEHPFRAGPHPQPHFTQVDCLVILKYLLNHWRKLRADCRFVLHGSATPNNHQFSGRVKEDIINSSWLKPFKTMTAHLGRVVDLVTLLMTGRCLRDETVDIAVLEKEENQINPGTSFKNFVRAGRFSTFIPFNHIHRLFSMLWVPGWPFGTWLTHETPPKR